MSVCLFKRRLRIPGRIEGSALVPLPFQVDSAIDGDSRENCQRKVKSEVSSKGDYNSSSRVPLGPSSFSFFSLLACGKLEIT
jgi:hypothetical protein